MEGGDAGNMHEGLEAASESVILILLGHWLNSFLDIVTPVVLGEENLNLVSAQKGLETLSVNFGEYSLLIQTCMQTQPFFLTIAWSWSKT